MVKIFFGCSMRGGYANLSQEKLSKFPNIIEELGHELSSRHQTQPGIVQEENKLTKTAIHDRDYKWIIESDMGVFEISNASLGVGGEISDMIHLGKPILCLFKKGLGDKVSAYIQGKMGSCYVKGVLECHSYETLDEAKEIIKKFVDANS